MNVLLHYLTIHFCDNNYNFNENSALHACLLHERIKCVYLFVTGPYPAQIRCLIPEFCLGTILKDKILYG